MKPTCKEIMCWDLFDMVLFYPGFRLLGLMKVLKLKVLITPLLLVPEVWDVKPTCKKSVAEILSVRSDLTVAPSLKVKQGRSNVKVILTRLLLIPDIYDVKPTYRISVAGNLLMRSGLTLGPP